MDKLNLGFGFINHGKQSENLFKKHIICASIVAVDKNVIKRLNTIWKNSSSRYEIDLEKCGTYVLLSTIALYLNLYSLHLMLGSIN